MVFKRKYNFEVAARLMTTGDLAEITDPTSDMGAAILQVLGGGLPGASLPVGGDTGEVLRKLSATTGDADWQTMSISDIVGLVAALAAKADDADLSGFTAALAAKADASALASLAGTVANKADTSTVSTLTTTVGTKATQAALDAHRFVDLADVDPTDPPDETVPMWSDGDGEYIHTNLDVRYAPVDPGTGHLLSEAAAPFSLFGFVIPEGEDPPPNLPIGLGVPIIGFSKAVPPSLVPTFLDDNAAQATHTVVLTTPETLDIGDTFCIAIGYSGEATVPDHFNVVFSTGAATVAFTTKNAPNTTAACVLAYGVVTTAIPASATISVSSRDVSNATTNRVHLIASLFRTQQIAASPLDVQAAAGGTTGSVMTAIGAGPTVADTAQLNELEIGLACWNSSTGATSRTLAGTNGWQLISQLKSEAASGRSLAAFYRVRSAIGKPQLTTLMTSNDGTTGTWAAQVAAFKAAF